MDASKRMEGVLKLKMIENSDVIPLPKIIASKVSPVFQIEPTGVYSHPVNIKIPINTMTKYENLTVYYYSESPSHSGWYRGENVQGWMVPGSTKILSENGQKYFEFAINHSGIIQLARINQVRLGGFGSLDYAVDGSSMQWNDLAWMVLLLCTGAGYLLRRQYKNK